MRFLTRLLKTPEEDENEDQDEFDAEESGLLMIPSLSGDREGAASPAADAPQAEVPAAEGELANPPSEGEASPAEDGAGEPVADGGETPDTTEESSPPQSEGAETVPEEAQTEEAPPDDPDDPMSMFRGSAKRTHMAPVLKDNLEDIPAVELLAVARSIRNSLLGKQAVSGAGQGNEKAA
jgi:hypothetical protein